MDKEVQLNESKNSTDNQDVILKIDNLCKGYKMFARKKDRFLETLIPSMHKHSMFDALKNLNLEVKKGEVLGILGKNGAGKSTLLKMITGVVTPTSGKIEVKGKISSLLELGTAFNPELRGIENIYQHGQVMGLTYNEIKAKEKEIIDFADIGDHLYQPVKTYSSGMFARLAFACAINVDPDILIVDEVLSVGDMAFQLKCFKKFEQFKKRGKTILFVSHSVTDILNNCTRTIIIDKGQKIFDGDVKEGVNNYKKLITGMLDAGDKEKVKKLKSNVMAVNDDVEWKQHFTLNPDMIRYGNNQAEIYDYGIFNSYGAPESAINNDDIVSIKLKMLFNEDIENPTVSITVKDFHGREICGTNTSFLNVYTGKYKAGDRAIFEFRQKLKLAPGKYTLSISCSRFDDNGDLIVMNRNYDAIIFEATSDNKMVGIFEINPKVEYKKIEE